LPSAQFLSGNPFFFFFFFQISRVLLHFAFWLSLVCVAWALVVVVMVVMCASFCVVICVGQRAFAHVLHLRVAAATTATTIQSATAAAATLCV
jgi:hypothetical protein